MNPPAQDQAALQPGEDAAVDTPPANNGSSKHARVVLDASGGDAPQAERISGAIDAARLYPDVTVRLAGDEEQTAREVDGPGGPPPNAKLVHAPEMIAMHESPVQALREKRNSSIVVGVNMVARGEADAFVSAGNTGAVAAASTLKLGRLRGVQRPGIAATMFVIDHPVVAIDVGANVNGKPVHLLQYGIMASVFAREVMEIPSPRVGLLNVGEEAAKGNDLVKQAFELLSSADLNFVGNVEPDSLFSNGCDIMVCDGFVGNVLLKTAEGLVLKLVGWMRGQVPQKMRYKLGFFLCKDLFRHLKQCSDYSEYGGAPLLGVKGVTIITHGTSDAQGICNAIREARAFVDHQVNSHLEDAVLKDAAARGLRT